MSGNDFSKTLEKSIKKITPNLEKTIKLSNEVEEITTGNKYQKYEYKIEEVDLRFKSKETEKDLNFLGDDGWELMSVHFDNTAKSVAIFKRVKFS